MDDETRFTDIFRAFHAQVTAFARRRASAEVAQDVVAATFLAAWRHLDILPADPLPWLYRAASFEIASQGRKDRRYFNMRERLSQMSSADLHQPDHAEQVASAEQWKEAFARLSEGEREVLRLVAWEQLRPHQAAIVLRCSPVAFKVRLHRARRHLEALIEVSPRALAEQPSSNGKPRRSAPVKSPSDRPSVATPQEEV